MLVLHAVRLKGFAGTEAIAARFGLDPEQTAEELLDAEAFGHVTRSAFAGLDGWSLTERGRRHNEAQLRDELDRAGARAAVAAIHDRFVPLNATASAAFTAWQLDTGRSTAAFHDPEARLDAGAFHDPNAQLETGRSTAAFHDLEAQLRVLEDDLTRQLGRFAGYHARFAGALGKGGAWITGVEVDSCHRVWFELHEDLIATLGITRA